MTVLYAKTAGGNWSAAGTWSTTGHGGADNSGPPLASTDVIFELGSGNVTVDTNVVCRSLNCTSGTGSYTGTLAHGLFNLSVGDATAGAGNVALKLSAGMTYTGTGGSSAIVFVSTSATQQSITTAGKTIWAFTFNGVGASWQLQDAVGMGGAWVFTTGTIDANSKIITQTGGTTFNGGGQTYFDVELNSSGITAVSGANTFTTLKRNGSAAKTDGVSFNANQTVTNLTLAGNSSINRIIVQSSVVGTPITLTTNSPTVSNADFQDITASGTGWDLHAITGLAGDAGGNSGMTLTTGVPQFWKTPTTGVKTWSTAGNWFLATNGGGGAGRVPLPQDDVTLDANSIGAASTNVQADMPRIGRSINFTGVTNTPTWLVNATTNTMYGSLTLVSGMTISGTAGLIFAGRSTFTITSAGRTITQGVQITAPGGTYALQDAYLSSASLQLNSGTFDAQNTSVNANVTILSFASSNSNARTLTQGSGTWVLTGNGSAIWSVSNATNFTLNRGNPIQCNYSGATGSRTIGHGSGGGGTEANSPDFSITAGTDIVAFSGTDTVGSINFTGFAGTWTSTAFTIYGSLTVSTGMTLSGASVLTFGATSGPKTITTNGNTLDFPVTLNGVGGSWQLGDNFTIGVTRTLTLTNGTFDANGHNFTGGFFSSSNANVRTITQGLGTWNLTGSNATVWTTNNATNLTVNRGNPVQFTYSGSVGTRTVLQGGNATSGTEDNVVDIAITAGSDIFSLSSSTYSRDINFTGFSGQWSYGAITSYGSLTISSLMTITSSASASSFNATSGTKIITTNGITLDFPIVINGIGGTFQAGDNLTMGSTRTLTLTNGTLNTNNKTINIGQFATSNANTRTLTIGAAGMNLNGTGTVFSCTNGTGLTLNQTGQIFVTDATATAKTWAGGNPVSWGATFSGDNITVNGSNNWSSLVLNTGGRVTGTLFQSSFSQTLTSFSTNGSAGNLCIIKAVTPGTACTFSSSLPIVVDYINLSDNTASGAVPFFGGSHSTNSGGNTNWSFTGTPTGTMASSEANDSMSASGTERISGSSSITESADTFAATAVEQFLASMATQEASDTLSGSGLVVIRGSLVTIEANDLMAAASFELIRGLFGATEINDLMAAIGIVVNPPVPTKITLIDQQLYNVNLVDEALYLARVSDQMA